MARPDSGAPVSERRLVSVLFADLVGFTTYSEHRDPEETRELLSRYFDSARQVIDRYGGTIEKFIGDAVMAVWGAPVAHEDDAERAVRAALELVEAVAVAAARPALPGCRRARECSPAKRRSPSAQKARAWWPATSSTPPRAFSRVAAPGTVLVGEVTRRATRGRDRLRGRRARTS